MVSVVYIIFINIYIHNTHIIFIYDMNNYERLKTKQWLYDLHIQQSKTAWLCKLQVKLHGAAATHLPSDRNTWSNLETWMKCDCFWVKIQDWSQFSLMKSDFFSSCLMLFIICVYPFYRHKLLKNTYPKISHVDCGRSPRAMAVWWQAHHYLPKTHKIPWVYDHNRRRGLWGNPSTNYMNSSWTLPFRFCGSHFHFFWGFGFV